MAPFPDEVPVANVAPRVADNRGNGPHLRPAANVAPRVADNRGNGPIEGGVWWRTL